MTTSPATKLADAERGKPLRIVSLPSEPALRRRLLELGFCEETVLRRLNTSGAILVSIRGTRVAMNRELAKKIGVAPVVFGDGD